MLNKKLMEVLFPLHGRVLIIFVLNLANLTPLPPPPSIPSILPSCFNQIIFWSCRLKEFSETIKLHKVFIILVILDLLTFARSSMVQNIKKTRQYHTLPNFYGFLQNY